MQAREKPTRREQAPQEEALEEPPQDGAAKVVFDLLWSYAPGVALCVGVTLAAIAAQALEERSFGHPYVEALVLAILIGMAIRALWTPGPVWRKGVAFSAKELLEVAVVLLGASASFFSVAALGPFLLAAIVGTVCAALGVSYSLSRLLGLPPKMSILIACGNSICGNSAIAAVAPTIGASADDIVSSISFTALLGVVMVLGLPLFIPLFGLSAAQYGVLAGLTVYAVPQVLAATAPAGLLATQIGTFVKLVRVLTLGPIVLALSIGMSRIEARSGIVSERPKPRFRLFRYAPWFIIGFLALAGLRTAGLVPDSAVGPIAHVSVLLTIVSMAALGLGVDVRVVGRVGGRVTAAVTLSLLALLAVALTLAQGFHPG